MDDLQFFPIKTSESDRWMVDVLRQAEEDFRKKMFTLFRIPPHLLNGREGAVGAARAREEMRHG